MMLHNSKFYTEKPKYKRVTSGTSASCPRITKEECIEALEELGAEKAGRQGEKVEEWSMNGRPHCYVFYPVGWNDDKPFALWNSNPNGGDFECSDKRVCLCKNGT